MRKISDISRKLISGMKSRTINAPKWLIISLKALGITSIAMMLSVVLVSPFSATTSTFFSSPEQSDFRFSDIFAQFADGRPVRQLDDRIVIVDIGNSNRHDIAEALVKISLCNPKAVGIDVMFAHPGEDDSDLVNAISLNPGIVMPVDMSSVKTTSDGRYIFSETGRECLSEPLPEQGVVHAAVNLPSSSESGRSRIREYVVQFPTAKGDAVPSFPLALAKATDPAAAQKLLARGKDRGIVEYHSREFDIIPSDDIENNIAKLEGKTVIVGALNDAYDMHATPVNSYMAGTMIHAQALATILDGSWYESAPGWLDYFLAILVCYLIVLLCITIKSPVKGILIRILQVLLLYLFVRIGYELFIENRLICNFSHTILMIAFGLFSVDLWNGVWVITGHVKKKLTNIITRNNTKQCEEFS